jgi:hypothetical protein
MLNKKQQAVVEELLEKMNARRKAKNYSPATIESLPPIPGRNPSRFYLVDDYIVARHWRRRPVRK